MSFKHTKQSRIFVNENHDNCTSCGRDFTNKETTHLGYNSNKKLIYVGDCCSTQLQSTIIRYSYSPRPYKVPEPNSIIWRFMDFTKFVSLISSKELFFTRADLFDDPFEGAKGLTKNKKKWDKYHLDFFETALKSPPPGHKNTKSDNEIKSGAKELLKQLDNVGSKKRKCTFINCWYQNESESEAMWKLYTSNLAEGIAIKSNYSKLYRALSKNPDIHIGEVNYIDFKNQFAGVNDSFWFKRKSFEHEKEVRALTFELFKSKETGLSIPVDLRILIDKVYLSPTSQKWFRDLTQNVMEKYGLRKKLVVSEILAEPFY